MTTYLGFDVLDQVPHNRTGSIDDTYDRGFTVLDNETGLRDVDVPSKAPAPRRPFLWTCFTRAEAAVLRAFIHARRGRAIPFWLPTYQQDLRLASDVSNGATGIVVKWIGYAQHLFPGGGWRRHVAFYDSRRQFTFRKITAATDPGGYATESLALSSPAPQAFPAATTIVSFLRLCRLEEDAVSFEWRGHTCEATIALREIPLEAPA